MEWLNIPRRVLDSPEFIGCEPVDRATWLCLMSYCCGQENSGVIVNVKSWGTRRWEQTVRVTLEEVSRKCELWKWDGDDLVVFFYPVDKEKEVRAKRAAALATNKAKNKRITECNAQRCAQRVAQRDADPSIPFPLSSTESGSEGGGDMVRTENPNPISNHVSLEECRSYFREMARTNGCPTAYTDEEVTLAFKSFEASKDQSGNWRWGKSLVGDWRAAIEARIGFHRQNRPEKPKRNLTPAERGLYTGPG